MSFVATTSTMRLPYVLPSRTIAIVEIMLRTSFCAVPALRRVEPAMTSGPTGTRISWSASSASSEPCGRDDRDRRRAGRARRRERAARERACVRSRSGRRRRRARRPRAPRSRRLLRRDRPPPPARSRRRHRAHPATSATTRPGGTPKVASHSDCVDGRETARRARADVDEAPSVGEPLHDGVDGCGDGVLAPRRRRRERARPPRS